MNRVATLVASPTPVDRQSAVTLHLSMGEGLPSSVGRFRVSVTADPHAKFTLPDPERDRLVADVEAAKGARDEFAEDIPTTMVMRELDTRRATHILVRGDFLRPSDVVDAGVPAILHPLESDETEMNRRDLAEWLVDADNPLTARVMINRMWAHFFGMGLVETENDFGVQGTPPTHPRLLDWLAHRYMSRGWSNKEIHRLIVTSNAYRRSSHKRPDLARIDPKNQLLARQNRLRVDAEIIRDVALELSGALERRIGGPSVYPPQPDGVYAFTQRQAAWPTSEGGDRYRRGLYTFFMRSAPYPMLTTFDVPRFNTTCTSRVRSNTPIQALNDGQFRVDGRLCPTLGTTPGGQRRDET